MLNLHLEDHEWPYEFTDHDREVVRAIVVDDGGAYYFCRAVRDDDFGRSTLIETSGGGVEPGEDLLTAMAREAGFGMARKFFSMNGTISVQRLFT